MLRQMRSDDSWFLENFREVTSGIGAESRVHLSAVVGNNEIPGYQDNRNEKAVKGGEILGLLLFV